MKSSLIKSIIFRYPILYWIAKPIITMREVQLKHKQNNKLKVIDIIIPMLSSDPLVRVDEFKGTFNMGAQSDLFRRLAIYGEYEPKLVKSCLQHLNRNKDVIDIGANIGFYSVLFAQEINKRVLSVEPTQNALKRLRQNIKLNNVESKVEIFEGVVSDHNGTLKIKSVVGKEEYSTICNPVHESIGQQQILEEEVECITLDDLIEKYQLSPGFIKMDVEGAEMLVFKGAMKTLTKHRPIIISELTDELLRKNGSSAAEIIELIVSANYKVIDPLNTSNTFKNQKFGEVLCIPLELLGAIIK